MLASWLDDKRTSRRGRHPTPNVDCQLTGEDDGHLVLARVGVGRNKHARKEGPLEDEHTAVERFCREFRPRT